MDQKFPSGWAPERGLAHLPIAECLNLFQRERWEEELWELRLNRQCLGFIEGEPEKVAINQFPEFVEDRELSPADQSKHLPAGAEAGVGKTLRSVKEVSSSLHNCIP
jgi:hypothetical protein